MADLYLSAASAIHMASMLVAGGAGLAALVKKPVELAADSIRTLHRALALVTAPCLALAGWLVLWFAGTASDLDAAGALFQMLMTVLAVLALPWGLALARESPPAGPAQPPSRFWIEVAAMTALVLCFSQLWFAAAQTVFDVRLAEQLLQYNHFDARLLLFCLGALAIVPVEEVLFRLGVQGMAEAGLRHLGRRTLWAVPLASAMWALGHAAYATPHGIKELQIFLIGLVLGAARRRWGMAAPILIHLGLNGYAVAVHVVTLWIDAKAP